MKAIRYALIALLLGALVACDTAGGLPNPPGGDGSDLEFLIRDVEIAPSTINLGESAVITWEASDTEVVVELDSGDVVFQDESSVVVEPAAIGGHEYSLTASLEGYDPETHTVTVTVLDPDAPPPPGPGEGRWTVEGTIITLDAALMTNATELLAGIEGLPNDPRTTEMSGVFLSGVASTWLLPHEGDKVTVAYIGEGVRTDHEDFGPALLSGYDFCANWECTEADNDVNPFSDAEEHHQGVALGTRAISVLAAASNNGLGSANFAGLNEDVIEVLPLKVSQPPLPAQGTSDFNAHPDAFLNALSYALGEEPTIEGLERRDPVGIIFFEYLYFNEDTGLTLTDEQQDTLRNLLEEAREQQVLIVLQNFHLDDTIAELKNDFGPIARDFTDIILSVSTGDCLADILPRTPGDEAAECPEEANVDVHSHYSSEGPTDYQDDIGDYLPGFRLSTIVGTAALLQHHTGFRGADLHDALITTAADCETCSETASPRLDLALGLPGPGSTVRIELIDGDQLIRHQEVTLNEAGVAEYAFSFDPTGNYTLQVTAKGETYTLDATRTEIHPDPLSGGSTEIHFLLGYGL